MEGFFWVLMFVVDGDDDSGGGGFRFFGFVGMDM